MLSLKDRALLSATSEAKTLGDVFEICGKSGDARELCSKSKAFWLNMFPKIGLGIMALCFEPLKDEYWPKLIEGLEDGRSYSYKYEFDFDFLEPVDPTNVPDMFLYLENFFVQKSVNPADVFKVTIPGIKLFSGTYGWAIEHWGDDEGSIITNFALCSKEMNDEDRIQDIMVLQLMETFIEYVKDPRDLNPNITRKYVITREGWESDKGNGIEYDDLKHLYKLRDIEDGIPVGVKELPDRNQLKTFIKRHYFAPEEGGHWFDFSTMVYFNFFEGVIEEGKPLSGYAVEKNLYFSIYKCRIY